MRQTITYILLLTAFDCFGTTTKVTRVIGRDTCQAETTGQAQKLGRKL